jgi:flagellar hook-associated protein 3 FlgL
MIGRISSQQIFQGGIDAIKDAQTRLDRIQNQLATGKKVLTPSDDPVGTAQALSLRSELNRIERLQSNSVIASNALALQESALTSSENVLQRARELTIRANSGQLTAADRRSIATEMTGLIEQLVATANTQDGNGEFIFAGFQSRQAPFALSGTGVTYSGDTQQREMQIAPGLTVKTSDSGARVFLEATPGNGGFSVAASSANTGTGAVGLTSADASFDSTQDYTVAFSQATPADPITFEVLDGGGAVIATGPYEAGDTLSFGGATLTFSGLPADGDTFALTSTNSLPPPATGPRGQSAFDTLIGLRDALLSDNGTPEVRAQMTTALNQGLQNIDQNLEQLAVVRTDVGTRMNRIDEQVNLNETFNLQLKKTLSEIEELDYADAIGRLNLQLVALEAAQQTFVKATGLSIFNYI